MAASLDPVAVKLQSLSKVQKSRKELWQKY
jgi:hypothetical protein